MAIVGTAASSDSRPGHTWALEPWHTWALEPWHTWALGAIGKWQPDVIVCRRRNRLTALAKPIGHQHSCLNAIYQGTAFMPKCHISGRQLATCHNQYACSHSHVCMKTHHPCVPHYHQRHTRDEPPCALRIAACHRPGTCPARSTPSSPILGHAIWCYFWH